MPGQLARLKGALTGRRIAVSSVLLTALCGSSVYAVGLGEIELNSALNQKFDAQIELTDARGLQTSEIVVRLGSNEDFKRVGVERFFFLTDLNFKVVQGRNGKTYLAVTSSQPISEPFLNFVVQVIWPSGRMLKEYTVLLDPPAFTDNVAPAIASPGRTDPGGGSAGRVDRPAPRSGTEVALSRPAPPRSAAPSSRMNSDGTYGVTDRDDTLWKIANQSKPGGASVQQTMLAIARINPEAFIGGNINLLKAGYVLRLPNESETKSVGASEAIAAVAEHNQAWQVYRQTGSIAAVGADTRTTSRMAGQVDATAPRTQPAPRTGPEGELRIVAGDIGATGAMTGTGGGQAIEALEAQLAASEEEVDRVSRERDEAVSRLDQTLGQTEQAQRQIEVRDQQIAQLQAQLDAARQTAPESAGAPEQPATTDGGVMGLLASPIVWAAGGIIAVLLLVAGLVAARRRRAAADAAPALFESRVRERSAAPVAAAAAATVVTTSSKLDAEVDDYEPVEEEPETVAAEEEEHTRAQTSDVIGEADIYIAYGRYPQALNLLVGALDEDPNRSDVRLKLLEIYADTKDTAAFEQHMAELVERCDDNEILLDARELEAKLGEEGGGTSAAAGKATEENDLAVEDFDLDLDADAENPRVDASDEDDAELALDLDTDDRGRGDELGGDLGMDFDADARRERARADARHEMEADADGDDLALVADGSDDSEFDLEDLELESEAPSATGTKPAAKSAAADDAFDFLDEEDTASTKLDLARAYIDMGDEDGAREILGEVLQEGSSEQQKQANELLAKLA